MQWSSAFNNRIFLQKSKKADSEPASRNRSLLHRARHEHWPAAAVAGYERLGRSLVPYNALFFCIQNPPRQDALHDHILSRQAKAPKWRGARNSHVYNLRVEQVRLHTPSHCTRSCCLVIQSTANGDIPAGLC